MKDSVGKISNDAGDSSTSLREKKRIQENVQITVCQEIKKHLKFVNSQKNAAPKLIQEKVKNLNIFKISKKTESMSKNS